jgi:hypothetical protein
VRNFFSIFFFFFAHILKLWEKIDFLVDNKLRATGRALSNTVQRLDDFSSASGMLWPSFSPWEKI